MIEWVASIDWWSIFIHGIYVFIGVAIGFFLMSLFCISSQSSMVEEYVDDLRTNDSAAVVGLKGQVAELEAKVKQLEDDVLFYQQLYEGEVPRFYGVKNG